MDQSDDIRGGMGVDGLMNLYKFVEEGGTLITEGSTATIFPEYNLTSGVTVETPADLFARGSILRNVFTDKASPLAYGYDQASLPVYFNQAPVLAVAGAGATAFPGGGRGAAGLSKNVTQLDVQVHLSPFVSTAPGAVLAGEPAGGRGGRGGRGGGGAGAGAGAGGGGGGGGFGGFGGGNADAPRPRVVLQFPMNPNDMLLSGTLNGGQALAGRAGLVDAPVGKGHVVMFGIRPFWRWQSQGTYMLWLQRHHELERSRCWQGCSGGSSPAGGNAAAVVVPVTE